MNFSSEAVRRIRIAALWLVSMVLINILVYHVADSLHFSQARSDLLDQAGIVSGHISNIAEKT